MKVIVFSVLAAVALGIGAAVVLDAEQKPAYERFVGSGARVGDPGHNLVGPNWTGEHRVIPSS